MSFKKGTGKQLIQIGLFQTLSSIYLFLYWKLFSSSGLKSAIISGTSSSFSNFTRPFVYSGDALSYEKINWGIDWFLWRHFSECAE